MIIFADVMGLVACLVRFRGEVHNILLELYTIAWISFLVVLEDFEDLLVHYFLNFMSLKWVHLA